MNRKQLVAGALVAIAMCLAGRVAHTAFAAAPVLKKVRVTNSTTDTGIRARCVGFGGNVHFTVDVPMGMQATETGVYAGDRGIVFYEDLNEGRLLRASSSSSPWD